MEKKQKEKHLKYAAILSGKISEIFDEESEWHIDKEELKDENNLTDFIHALANIMPTHVFNTFTGDEKNHLEFNHIANQLVFQYLKKSE